MGKEQQRIFIEMLDLTYDFSSYIIIISNVYFYYSIIIETIHGVNGNWTLEYRERCTQSFSLEFPNLALNMIIIFNIFKDGVCIIP